MGVGFRIELLLAQPKYAHLCLTGVVFTGVFMRFDEMKLFSNFG